jgi:hypothetical protein
MATATLREFLKIHPDHRTITRSPRQCARLVNDPEHGTVLEPVTITEGFSATLTETTPEGFYVAKVAARAIGSQAPDFSITGEHWKSEKHWRNDWERSGLYSVGAMGDTLAEVFPELAPLNALHLADAVTGEPMYAFENGWYHYSNENADAAARLLRVESLPEGMTEDDFRAFVVSQRERWEREAEEGRALIRSLA